MPTHPPSSRARLAVRPALRPRRGVLVRPWGDRLGICRRVSYAVDFTLPVAGGLAGILHALLDDDRLARWLRANSNPNYEPDIIA